MAVVPVKTMLPEPQILPTTVRASEGVVVAMPNLVAVVVAKVEVAATSKVPAKLREVDHWGAVPEEVKTVLASPMVSLAKVVVAVA